MAKSTTRLKKASETLTPPRVAASGEEEFEVDEEEELQGESEVPDSAEASAGAADTGTYESKVYWSPARIAKSYTKSSSRPGVLITDWTRVGAIGLIMAPPATRPYTFSSMKFKRSTMQSSAYMLASKCTSEQRRKKSRISQPSYASFGFGQ